MYKLLINLLSRQSIPVPFKICINFIHLTRSNAFFQSMKQTHRGTQKLHNGSRIRPSENRLFTHCYDTKLGFSLTSTRLSHRSKHTLNQHEGKSNTASCTYNVTFRRVCISVFCTLNRLSYYLSHRGHTAVFTFYTNIT
jgi:hypothetical protein